MKRECDIPEWNKNQSLRYVSKVVGRPIVSTDELTSKDIWELLFAKLGIDKNKIVS